MCTSYFIEPVQWMEQAMLGVMDGQVTQFPIFSEYNSTVHSFSQNRFFRGMLLHKCHLVVTPLCFSSFSCCVPSVDLSWALSAGMVISVPVVVGSRLPSSCIATEWMRSDN